MSPSAERSPHGIGGDSEPPARGHQFDPHALLGQRAEGQERLDGRDATSRYQDAWGLRTHPRHIGAERTSAHPDSPRLQAREPLIATP